MIPPGGIPVKTVNATGVAHCWATPVAFTVKVVFPLRAGLRLFRRVRRADCALRTNFHANLTCVAFAVLVVGAVGHSACRNNRCLG